MEKKKISLRGISEILSEKELKNVMGGSDSCPAQSSTCSGSCTITVSGNSYAGTCKTLTGTSLCACYQN